LIDLTLHVEKYRVGKNGQSCPQTLGWKISRNLFFEAGNEVGEEIMQVKEDCDEILRL